MAEPGLLVLARPDGCEDWFRAQWGGSDRTLAAVLDATPRSVLATAPWAPARRGVEPGAWQRSVDQLRTSAVYICDGDGIAAYLPLWFGLPTAGLDAAPAAGVLVRVESVAGARALRGEWRRLKRAVADAVADGRIPLPLAAALLAGGVAGRETVGSPFAGP